MQNNKTAFISDIHFGLSSREIEVIKEDYFIKLTDKLALENAKIYFVGDIFDFWFEYKTVVPKYFYRILNQIYKLRKSGIEIEYLMGNHDFGHVDFFRNEMGIEIHMDDIQREIDGKKFYITHGDGKGPKDNGYKMLKSILRNKFFQKLFFMLHPDFGIRLASGSSKKSRSHTDKKDYKIESQRIFAYEKLEQGYDYVICGHRHKAEISYHAEGTYVNLGEWISKPKFALFENSEIKIINVEDYA